MPRLLAILPCEHAIVAKEDDSISLITVLQNVDITIPDDAIGQNAMLPFKWAIFAYWLSEPGDEGITFEQRLEVVLLNTKPLMTQDSRFSIAKKTHSQIARLNALAVPSIHTGDYPYSIRVSLRRVGEEAFKTYGEFPLTLTFIAASSQTVSP